MAMQIGAPAGNSLKVAAPPSSSMARPFISPGAASLRGAFVGNSNFNKVAPASSNAGLGAFGAMLLVTVLWTGRTRVSLAARGRKSPCGDGGHGRERSKSWRVISTLQNYATKLVKMRGEAKSLKARLEQVEMKAALNDAANTEMQLALEEELAHHKAAQRMLEHHFVGAQTGYNDMSFLLEATKAEHSALSDRLKRSSAAQEKAENEMKSLKAQMTRLSTACSTLLKKIKSLSAQLKASKEENEALRNENKTLKDELAEQKVLIKELFKLQEDGEQRRQQLLAENNVLQRRLENAERQVAVLLEN